MSVYHAPLACAPVNLAMMYASYAVDWSRDYARYAYLARTSVGRDRCRYAAIAGDCKRRARRYAANHNDAIKAIRR